jgi:WD40 repeat protein
MLQVALAESPEAVAAAAARGRAHEGAVVAMAFTPDGRTLVTSTMEDSKAPIKIWSVADGRLLGALTGDCPSVWGLRVSGDGASVLATCMNKTLRQWSVADRREKPALAELKSGMADLGVTADGRLVAAGGGFLGSAGTVALVALPSGRTVGTISLPEGASRIALSPDGRTLVSAGFDSSLQLWSVPDGRLAATLGKSADATALAFSPDGRLLALASAREISLWSLAERKQVGSITGHAFIVNGLAFCPDGRLLSASSDHSVKLWSVPDGRLATTLRGHTTEVYGVAVSPDGKLAVSSDSDGGVVLWDLQKNERLRALVDPATPARVNR